MLSSVVVEEEEVLSHLAGKWMSPFALRAALKRAGVNIFPAGYSPKYVPVPRKVSAGVSWWFFSVFPPGHPFLLWELLCCQLSQGPGRAGPGTAVPRGHRSVCLTCTRALQAALAEAKAYEQMALLAAAFAFARSKWNGEAGPERVVFKVCAAPPKAQSRAALTLPQSDRNNSLTRLASAPASAQCHRLPRQLSGDTGHSHKDTC